MEIKECFADLISERPIGNLPAQPAISRNPASSPLTNLTGQHSRGTTNFTEHRGLSDIKLLLDYFDKAMLEHA